MNLDLRLTSYMKMNPEYITHANLEGKTARLLEKKIGENLRARKEFINITQSTKGTIDKLDFIKIKNFCSFQPC